MAAVAVAVAAVAVAVVAAVAVAVVAVAALFRWPQREKCCSNWKPRASVSDRRTRSRASVRDPSVRKPSRRPRKRRTNF